MIVPVTIELFTHLLETIDGCLHPTLMAVSHIIDLEFLSHREETSEFICLTTGTMSLDLELLFDGAVGNAVRLEDKPWTIEQVAITRLFWEVGGGVAGVRVRQQQVQSNKDEDKDQDWGTVCHYKYQRFLLWRTAVFESGRSHVTLLRKTQREGRECWVRTWVWKRSWEWDG